MRLNKRLVAPCVLAAALLAGAADAPCQTDLSLRTRSLSPRFAGVVEDLVTDAFLNPARLSAFAETQIYIARNPQRAYWAPFPRPFDFYNLDGLLPPEGYSRSTWRQDYRPAPYELTLFTGLGAGTRASFSLTFFSDAGDEFEENDSVDAWGTDALRFSESARGGRDELTSFSLRGGVSTGDSPDDHSLGLRVIVARHTRDVGTVESRTSIHVEPVNELYLNSRLARSTSEFTQLDALVSGGTFRPGSMLREFIITAGYSSREFDAEALLTDSEDNDFDGNGVGIGGSPSQDYRRVQFSGERTYDGPVIQSRLHMDLTDRTVFTAGGFYEYRTGSGPASHSSVLISNDVNGGTSTTIQTPYEYDGTDTRYGLSATIGYREELIPSVLLALGGSFEFRRVNFSETGTGSMSVEVMNGSPVSGKVDYAQTAWRVDDDMYLRLPAGVEWLPIKQLALRVGMELTGYRREETRVFRREPDNSSLPTEYQRADEFSFGRTADDTLVQLNTGIGVNLAERLFIDLLYQSSSYVSLASFSYVSMRFSF